MSKGLITEEMFKNISYDTKISKNTNAQSATENAGDKVHSPTLLIVFANSDINAALYHLLKSMESPFEMNAIATVLVQESIKDDFIEKLQPQLKPYDNELVQHHDSLKLSRAMETANKLNARVIPVSKVNENSLAPFLVCDFTHEQLGCFAPSGAVTLHTFRTAKEAISLVNKESLKFSCVSIWHENHSYAYEIISSLTSSIYCINCLKDPADIFKDCNVKGENCVSMNETYHYEKLQYKGIHKFIVFPIGSIFAN